MAVEFKHGMTAGVMRVETVDLNGGRRWLGDVDLVSALFRSAWGEPLEAEELERIAERLHSIRRKRRQALREANDGRGI
jgi:hypothetical protein